MDVDGIEIGRAQCRFSHHRMHFSVLYILFYCVFCENEATATDIYMRIAFRYTVRHFYEFLSSSDMLPIISMNSNIHCTHIHIDFVVKTIDPGIC